MTAPEQTAHTGRGEKEPETETDAERMMRLMILRAIFTPPPIYRRKRSHTDRFLTWVFGC